MPEPRLLNKHLFFSNKVFNSGGKASDLGTEYLFPTCSVTLKILSQSSVILLNQSLPNKAGRLPCTTTRSRTFSSLEEYLTGTEILPKMGIFSPE